MKALKIGGITIGVLLLGLVVLRFVGPEPANVSPRTVVEHQLDIFVRPGFWQTGELVTTPVEDWSFLKEFSTVVIETRSPWFIPHSVRTTAHSRDNGTKLYIPSAQYRMEKGFPDRLWTSNVWRDPRVRMKAGSKLYELTLVLVTDRAEAEAVWGRNMGFWTKENGVERQVGYQHLYRAFQRNVTEFGEFTKPRDFSGLPGAQLRRNNTTPPSAQPDGE
ncbi:MAG: hypothetical protein FJW23_03575 [Acidimicrobiia bacterium]|nr:hypothetical protein [Acidimicrobiia bacterium]